MAQSIFFHPLFPERGMSRDDALKYWQSQFDKKHRALQRATDAGLVEALHDELGIIEERIDVLTQLASHPWDEL